SVATIPPAPSGPLNERLRSARGYARLTQDALLDRMHDIDPDLTPTRRTYSKWENGAEISVNELRLIAKATGFPLVWVVMDLEEDQGAEGDGTPADLAGQAAPCMTDNVGPVRGGEWGARHAVAAGAANDRTL